VHQAWLAHVASGGKTLLEPRLLQAGTSLLTPGIIEMSAVAQVADEEVFGRCSASGAMTISMRRLPSLTRPVSGFPAG
jgi:hypothetical protein